MKGTPMSRRIDRVKIVRRDHHEWVVRAYDENGLRIPNADYYTSDRKDAEQTAERMVPADLDYNTHRD